MEINLPLEDRSELSELITSLSITYDVLLDKTDRFKVGSQRYNEAKASFGRVDAILERARGLMLASMNSA